MNNRTALWVVVLLGLAALTLAADDYEYDDAPAPVKPAPLRPSPLLRQARGPAIGRPSPKTAASKTTTTTTEPPPLEYEDEEGEEGAVEEEEVVVTTTTEAPKKKGLQIRPFRSNEALIERLKRRREQQQKGPGPSTSTTTTTSAPGSLDGGKSFGKNSRRTGGNKISDQTGSTSERKSSAVNGNRRFTSGRGKTTEAPVEPEVVEEEQPRQRSFGRGRRF